MLSPDEFVDEFINDLLLHAEVPYDPQKAHEYYLLNRDLKGRTKGEQQQSTSRSRGVAASPVRNVRPPPIQLTSKQRQDAVNARVAALQTNLAKLKEELQERLDAAKKKEEKEKNPETKEKKEEKKEESGPDEKSKLTAQEKKKAAIKSKEYYEEHKYDKLSVDELRLEIKKIEEQLRSAIAEARSMMPVKKSQGKKSQGKKPQGKKPQGKKPQGKKPQGKPNVAQKKVSEVKPTGNFLTRITDWVNSLFR